MQWDEYTENTNTGILHPPRDHSFDTLKAIWRRIQITVREGFWLACLIGLAGFWAVTLGSSVWKPQYVAQLQFDATRLNDPSTTHSEWLDLLAKDEGVLQSLRQEQKAGQDLKQNSFYKIEQELVSALWPTNFAAPVLNADRVRARLDGLLNITTTNNGLWQIRLEDGNVYLLQAVKNALERTAQNNSNSKVQFVSQQNTLFSKEDSVARLEMARQLGWITVTILTLLITAAFSPQLAKSRETELKMAFPFPILGLLPENSPDLSPTILNDAFELLRTNVSMQRSVFSFSSITLVWPFEKSGTAEFLTRMASDYGKTTKKVLVIETERSTLPRQAGFESRPGLTDLHLLVKEAPPQSEKENEIFWKLYEFVFGTDDKFYCLQYGQAEVAPDILFEKYNFRRILNLLKKHFSLILFNAPKSVDLKKPLPWSTLQDATLIVANYKKHSSVACKDELKDITCAQRFVLGGVLVDVPQSTNTTQILKYDVKLSRVS